MARDQVRKSDSEHRSAAADRKRGHVDVQVGADPDRAQGGGAVILGTAWQA